MTTEPEREEEALRHFFTQMRQGDVLPCATAAWAAPFPIGTESVAVVSQTCDVVLAKRAFLTLAQVVTLTDGDATAARRRDNPRYVGLPLAAGNQFVDLCHLHTVSKQVLFEQPYTPGLSPDDDTQIRSFALAVGRWFSRFAFPDEVTPWLRPLYAVIRSKYDKPSSPLGQILQDVVELRLEADNWSAKPLSLTLHVIVRAGVLPTLENSDPTPSRPAAALRPDGTLKAPAELAPLILSASHTNRLALWGAMAEAMADLCYPKPGDAAMPGVASAVSEVAAELWSDDEFTLSHIRKSELLDLDYLSPGYPA